MWPPVEKDCERDYAQTCPYGWRIHGRYCIAPAGYSGCSPIQDFTHMIPHSKRLWSRACTAPWPCTTLARSMCRTDWDALCPVGFYSSDGGSTCLSTLIQRGVCSNVLRGVARLGVEGKRNLSVSCGVTWPCVGEAAGMTNMIPLGVGAPRGGSFNV